jgi:beta-galactosidase
MPRPVEGGGHVQLWQEELEGNAEVTLRGADGQPLAMTDGRITYLGAWLDAEAMAAFLRDALTGAGVEITDMPGGLRRRQAGKTEFLINYDPEPQTWDGVSVPAAGVAWR